MVFVNAAISLHKIDTKIVEDVHIGSREKMKVKGNANFHRSWLYFVENFPINFMLS